MVDRQHRWPLNAWACISGNLHTFSMGILLGNILTLGHNGYSFDKTAICSYSNSGYLYITFHKFGTSWIPGLPTRSPDLTKLKVYKVGLNNTRRYAEQNLFGNPELYTRNACKCHLLHRFFFLLYKDRAKSKQNHNKIFSFISRTTLS